MLYISGLPATTNGYDGVVVQSPGLWCASDWEVDALVRRRAARDVKEASKKLETIGSLVGCVKRLGALSVEP